MLSEGTDIHYLVGTLGTMYVRPLVPYSDLACEFLSNLSSTLLVDGLAKKHPDIVSFAYWCRRANLAKLKQEFAESRLRLGLGRVFHITPSNVPINFAFSFVFSLLAGNANIVRVPTKGFLQTDIVCRVINQLFSEKKFEHLAKMTCFVRYQQNDEVTAAFSADSDARIIWGGDQSINHIRQIPISVRGVEVVFADRYSFCVIDAQSIMKADEVLLDKLAHGFFNDVFLMDQNACSSPHLVVWLGEPSVVSEAKRKFWQDVQKVVVAKYDLQPVQVIDKYTQTLSYAIDVPEISHCQRYGNFVYCIQLKKLSSQVDVLRGQFGCFYEFDTDDLNSLTSIVTKKYQTLTYFGVGKDALTNFVLQNNLLGIDRIVPIGSALDISVIWDGYDLVRTLSRICDIR